MVNRRDIIIGISLLGALLVIFLFVMALISAMTLQDIHVSKKSVAIIEITGVIISPSSVVERLERYIRNDNIPAIVLRLNTPGGGVAPTQEIYDTVLKARQKGKKIIGSMGTVAASGGYYIASACDSIMANPGTITGSIGVIADFVEFSNLLKKLGIDITVVKSGKYKDIGSISRPMSEEEKELISGVIMDTYDQFVQAVSKGRRMDVETVKKYADGRIFTGRQAKNLGFIDKLGTYQDAIDMAGRITGIGANPPVVKEDKELFWDIITKGMSKILFKSMELSLPHVSYLMMQ
ncbi:MAG: signal peptide peptidase SppA [Candidatus Latescibacter sp.]|nr:signal peptide peptidase SppA [Candidatus Latescibacter sp.]